MVPELKEELLEIEGETFEVLDLAQLDQELGFSSSSCSCSSTCSCSTSSCCATTSSSCSSTSSCS